MAREVVRRGDDGSNAPRRAPRDDRARFGDDPDRDDDDPEAVPDGEGETRVPEEDATLDRDSRLVLSTSMGGDEETFSWALRPRTLAEYVGQRTLVEKLDIAITAAKMRGEALEHLLLHGPPGLGKTTIAHVIARELGTNLVTTSGPALERPGDLIGILTNLEQGDVLFIDEVHRLGKTVEEFLYPALEDFKVDFIVDRGTFAKSIKVPIKPFSLVAATTRSGLLSAPLRNRFGMTHHLDFYTVDELAHIVTRSAKLLKVETDAEAATDIAARSRGTPRLANRLLRWVRNYADARSDGHISKPVADAALAMEGVDDRGLDPFDRRFLAIIINHYAGGPVGIEAIAATLNEEVDTLVDLVEPYLLKIGLLVRTKSGRKATIDAVRHLKQYGSDDDNTLPTTKQTLLF